MKILVTGARGMLGKDLMVALPACGDVTGVDIDDFDITDRVAAHEVIGGLRPDLVVHAAAFARVDACETEHETAFRVNRDGAENVALACGTIGARMIYFSSDYIFDGTATVPYRETDPANPLSVYGKSKYEGEQRVVSVLPDRHLIIRTAWLFGVNGPNFIDTIIRLARKQPELRIVRDQTGSPTSSTDLARATCELILRDVSGIVNVTNSGVATWYDLAVYALDRQRIDIPVHPIPTAEFPRPAPRPAYSVLSPVLRDGILGKPMPPWKDAVDRFLDAKQRIHPGKESIE